MEYLNIKIMQIACSSRAIFLNFCVVKNITLSILNSVSVRHSLTFFVDLLDMNAKCLNLISILSGDRHAQE